MPSNRPGRWAKKTDLFKLEDDIGTNYECLVCGEPFKSRTILATHKHKKKVVSNGDSGVADQHAGGTAVQQV